MSIKANALLLIFFYLYFYWISQVVPFSILNKKTTYFSSNFAQDFLIGLLKREKS